MCQKFPWKKKKIIQENLGAKFCPPLAEFVIKFAFVFSLKQDVVGPPFPSSLPSSFSPSPSPGCVPAPCAHAVTPLAVLRMSRVVRICQVTPQPVRTLWRVLCPAAAHCFISSAQSLATTWPCQVQITTAGQNELAVFFLLTCHIPMAFAKLISAVINASLGHGKEASTTLLLVHVCMQAHAGTELNKSSWFWAEWWGLGYIPSHCLSHLSPFPPSFPHSTLPAKTPPQPAPHCCFQPLSLLSQCFPYFPHVKV